MAMNKKEQAAFEALQEKAKLNRALRWSDFSEEHDMPMPEKFDDYANGWSINVYSASVYPTWSSGSSHGNREADVIVDNKMRRERHISGSQNGIRQFSTKKLALQALRRAVERKVAEQLLVIDNLLAAED